MGGGGGPVTVTVTTDGTGAGVSPTLSETTSAWVTAASLVWVTSWIISGTGTGAGAAVSLGIAPLSVCVIQIVAGLGTGVLLLTTGGLGFTKMVWRRVLWTGSGATEVTTVCTGGGCLTKDVDLIGVGGE